MDSVTLETIYLIALIASLLITFLYLIFSDIAEVGADGFILFDPAILLIFASITAGAGYLFEKLTNIQSLVALVISIVISSVITALIYFFLLIPIRSAEVSLVYTEQSLEGQVAKVIVPIPVNGFGEIIISSVNGVINKRAGSYHNVDIEYGETCLIIEMKDGTAYVVKYEQPFEEE